MTGERSVGRCGEDAKVLLHSVKHKQGSEDDDGGDGSAVVPWPDATS